MISLKEIKSRLETEAVVVNKQNFECVKDTNQLIAILNEIKTKGTEHKEEKEISRFVVGVLNSLFYKKALLNEWENTFYIISSLALLMESNREIFRSDDNYQNFIVCALACMEKDVESFKIITEKLLPAKITNCSLAFNLACMSNVHGKQADALKYTGFALKLGYPKKEFFSDPQLKSLQDNPTFNAIIDKAKLLSGERLFFEKLDAVIRYMGKEKDTDIETGDNLVYYIAEFINDKSKEKGEKLQLVKTWLEVANSIPVCPDRKQYLAQFAFTVITEHPEMVDEMERKLLPDEMTDYAYFINIADVLASMEMPEKAYKYTDIAMVDRVDKDIIQYREGLKKLYQADEKFRFMIDAHDQRKKEEKEYLLEEPDPESFEEVYKAAMMEFNSCYSYKRSDRIVAITKFREEAYHKPINDFLKTGFDRLRQRLKKKDSLIEEVLFDALVVAIAEWQDPSYIELLLEEFSYVADEDPKDGICRHYELNLVAGTIAVALSALEYKGSTSIFKPFLESFEWRYKGEPFVMKVLYGKWMIEKNAEEALFYLQDEENRVGLGYAVCALADLNSKESLPYLVEIQRMITNPVTVEIFKEAIDRLKNQSMEPSWEKRMIRLFGTATPTAIALGADNDNEFLVRARDAKKNNKSGVVYEADDSAEDDR